ncbi:hypothetical protein [Megasphaera massiliensis]|jgi:hypothetical protein|uniref:hypothetical protein n=1 Tax=Megasphaera massiliensis TaxID=1232428 RepID=UPI00040F567B|nr:hypothetical protein [Megasphaera massiliensis]MCQ5211169.1 hypothetical protein [Megasphaera massiliensis]DAF68380.1 MAG TPA: large terminase protein [Caudoviricetes sp.]
MKAAKTANKNEKERQELAMLMQLQVWSQNPTEFIDNCCFTVNEAKRGAVEHFPKLDYLARVDKIIHGEQVAAFPKSRRMMMTWRCLANLLHFAMFGKNLSIFVQSKKYDDSAYLLGDSRLLFLYEHLPAGYPWPKVERKTRSKMGYDYIKLSNGVEFRAVAEGADQLRQYTASVVYCTEMAFWDFAQATWNSLRPTIEGGGRIFIDSSANPGFFCQLVTGQLNEDEPEEEQEPHDVMQGVHEYRRNGVYVARIHYSADPSKRSEEWRTNEKKGTTTEGWEREYEINWTVSAEPKYYPEFNYNFHVANEELKPVPGRPLIRGWDYGLTPATVIGQTTAKGQLLILTELQSWDCGMLAHGRAVSAEMATYYNGYDCTDIGDPAGNQRAQSDESTANQLLYDNYGIRVDPGELSQTGRSEAIRYFLTTLTPDGKPLLLLDPRCQMLIEAFTGGYHRKVVAGRTLDEPEKNEYSHLMDCLAYMCAKLYRDKDNGVDKWRKMTRGKMHRAGFM